MKTLSNIRSTSRGIDTNDTETLDTSIEEKILRTRLEGLQTQLNILVSQLNDLEIQKTKYGLDAPPRLSREIEDVHKEMKEKENEIRQIRFQLAELHT